MLPVYTITGEEIFRKKEPFSLSVRHLQGSKEMLQHYGRQMLPAHGMLTGTRYLRGLMHVHRVFLTGLQILAATIFTGRLLIGQHRITVSYLHDGFSSEHSAPFSEFTEKARGLYSPTTGMPQRNLYC